MATFIAQYCFLLSRCSSHTKLILRSIKPAIVCENTLLRHCVRQTLGYGSRVTDNTQQDIQVDIPVGNQCASFLQELLELGSTVMHIANSDRLTISYSRSGGPGGQHVNKVNTKAEVRFHVRTADWIPEDIRHKVIEKNKNRINKAGELLVTSELSRNQHRNLGNCIQKISDIIAEASEKPHEPTAEDIALRAARLEKRNKERLKLKKIHSATKQSRRVDFD